ncbi:MAG: response regulator [Bacteroidales bacterium]|nr:response regulator [Bacteroidales bacterium]
MESIELLLVEDSIFDAELTIRALQKHKLANKLHHVKDGEEALQFLNGEGAYTDRDINQLPKLILLDLKLPKVTGIDVLQEIRNNPRTQKIPVVVLTSSKEDYDIQKCYEYGVSSYIVKPVDFNKFMDAVAEIGYYWMFLNEPPTENQN